MEGDAKEKKISAENEVKSEFDPKIKDTESILSAEEEKFNEAVAKIAEWNIKKKELKGSIKALKKELTLLTKEKSKKIRMKLKEIDGELKQKIKNINIEIKELQKKLTALKKAPST